MASRNLLAGRLALRAARSFILGLGLATSVGSVMAGEDRFDARPFSRVVDVSIADALSGAIAGQPAPAKSARQVAAGQAITDARVTVLAIDPVAAAAIAGQTRVRLPLPIDGTGSLTLELDRFDLFTPDAVIVVADEHGERALPRPDVQLWRGHVAGDPDSRVFIGLRGSGAQGYVVVGDKTYSISTVPETAQGPLAGRTVTVDVQALRRANAAIPGAAPAPVWTCAGAIVEPGVTPLPVNTGLHPELRGPICRTIRVAVDTDTELTVNLFSSNTANATAYLTQLMGAVSSIYQNDVSVQIQVPFMRVWTGADPYSAGDTSSQLTQFRSYWIANRPAVTHELAHLICARALGGGVAYLNTLCDPNLGFGVSANINGTFPAPLHDNDGGNWDVNVVTHEIGHNFGSGHTHDPTSYQPPIDGCGAGYLTPPKPQDCTVANQHLGTIMSYCHICPGGEANLKMTFGPRPSQVIRDSLGFRPGCGIVSIPLSVSEIQLTSSYVCIGGTLNLTAITTGSNLTFAWYHAGVLIPGQTGPTLSVPNLQLSGQGDYWCTASNECGTVTSSTFNIFICWIDFDCSQSIGPNDIFSFMAAWFAKSPNADVNGVGGVTVQDIFDFVGSWFGGSC